jgi:xanthine dehydrogenase accessory factor
MKNIYLQILDQQSVNSPLVLATVVRTQGSTPQKPGSSALFCNSTLLAGTVGGGIVEEKVRKAASEAIISGNSNLLSFSLINDIANKEEAICGGLISVLLDANLKNSLNLFRELKASFENRIP